MVVLLHVSHFCCRCFTTIVPRLTSSQNKVSLTIMGRGSKGLCSKGRHKEKWAGKNSQGSWGRDGGGVERYSLSISFHPWSSVRATCHYIQPTCISERLVWNSLNRYKLSLVFILDRAVDTSQIGFPNVPSPGFVSIRSWYFLQTLINKINFVWTLDRALLAHFTFNFPCFRWREDHSAESRR